MEMIITFAIGVTSYLFSQQLFSLSPEDSKSGIEELVRGMLRLDPAKRLLALAYLHVLRFFNGISLFFRFVPSEALLLPFVSSSLSSTPTAQGAAIDSCHIVSNKEETTETAKNTNFSPHPDGLRNENRKCLVDVS